MQNIKGCLKQLCESGVMSNYTDPEQLKARVIKDISDSSVNEVDKRKIIVQLTPLTTCDSIQIYIYNSMLKFNGLGTIPNRNRY
jgi:hypothetical protein